MRDTRKTTSIARHIAWDYQWKYLWRIFWQTALLGAVAVFAWCAATETASLGKLAESGTRGIVLNLSGVWPTRELFWQALSREIPLGHYVTYTFGVPETTVPMGGFVFWLMVTLGAFFLLRMLGWMMSALGATQRIRRYLKPIDDIAQVTESISAHGFDEGKFHSLEDAIDHLNGASADEKLQIGDDDLLGLETAVNNLIVRMHNSYRQQVRFVDDASHELRTPIAVIQGYADMLDRWGKTDQQVLEESIRAIQTETEHMKTLVEQLLFLARGDAGRQSLNMTKLDISALTGEVWEESQMIDPAHDYIYHEETPAYVWGDEAMLKQAMRILVENAAKYSPAHSRITLRAYGDGTSAFLDVQDNGIGISQKDAPRIFDRFYRADAARNSETGGSGLGLSIARWIVGRHGGSFRVKSYEDVGTRITIVLPILNKAPAELTAGKTAT